VSNLLNRLLICLLVRQLTAYSATVVVLVFVLVCSLVAGVADVVAADDVDGRWCSRRGGLVDLRSESDAALDLHGPCGSEPGAPGEGELQGLGHICRFSIKIANGLHDQCIRVRLGLAIRDVHFDCVFKVKVELAEIDDLFVVTQVDSVGGEAEEGESGEERNFHYFASTFLSELMFAGALLAAFL